jgi:hypothetical protein
VDKSNGFIGVGSALNSFAKRLLNGHQKRFIRHIGLGCIMLNNVKKETRTNHQLEL